MADADTTDATPDPDDAARRAHDDAASALGTVETGADGRTALRYVRRIAHPIDVVWDAITNPELLRGWLGEATVDLTVGGRFDVRWLNTDDQGNSAVRRSVITRLEPPRLLETDGDPHGILRFELEPDAERPGGTILRFVSTLAIPSDEMRLKVLAGWHVHLEYLEDALVGRPVDWPRWTPEGRWQELHDRYAEREGA